MITKEQAIKIDLDSEYLLAAHSNSEVKILGYDPIYDGQEFSVSIQFSSDPDSPQFDLFLPLDGNWWMSIDDQYAATRKQLSQVFKSDFFKRVRKEILEKLDYLQKNPEEGNFVWVDETGKKYDGSYDEYRNSIERAKKALLNPAKYVDKSVMRENEDVISEENPYSGKNLIKWIASGHNPKFDPERLRRKQSIDSYHLKQLPILLKKVFSNSFESVEVKRLSGYDDRYQMTIYVNKPDTQISQANRIERVLKLVPEIRRILDYVLRTQNIHIDFNDVTAINTSFKRDLSQVQEGEGGGIAVGGPMSAGGSIGGEASSSDISPGGDNHGAISTEDVLGKFDPKKGCMGKGDFHLPCVLPLGSRWGTISGKKKKKNKKNSKILGKVKVIKNYSDLTEDEKNQLKPILVYNLPQNRIEEILDGTTIENERYSKDQFLKYLGTSDVEYVGLFSKFPKECFAMAVLAFERAQDDDCYVAEIQSFKSGFGQDLLLKILQHNKKLWLCCDPTAGEKLLQFYRRPCFGFKEHVIKNSIWNNEAHFFYTPECDEENLIGFIDANYDAKKQVSEDEKFDLPDIENQTDSFVELKPEQVVKSDYVYFQTTPHQEKTTYKYSAHIVSMNGNPELEYDDQIISDHQMSIKEVFNELWKRVPSGYNVSKDMDEAHRVYHQQLEQIKNQNQGKSQQEIMTLQLQIPFPMIADLCFGSIEDGIKILPDKETYDEATKRGIPAGYYKSDDTSEVTFNKLASDKLYLKRVIGG